MTGFRKRIDITSNLAEVDPAHALTENEVESVLNGASSPLRTNQPHEPPVVMNSTVFGLLAEFGAVNIPLEKIAPKYFGMSYPEARRNALAKLLPCRAFRLGGQKSPWLVSALDLAAAIDRQRAKAG